MNSSRTSKPIGDPLSEVLSLLKLGSARCTRFEAAGDWALAFPDRARIKFVAVLKGGCWVVMPDAPPTRLEVGDTFLLARTGYVIASQPNIEPRDATYFYAEGNDTERLGGDDVVMIGGSFVFDDGAAGALVDALPKFMLIAANQSGAAILNHTLAMLDLELRQSAMGTTLMAQHLADILLVQALRAHASNGAPAVTGWLAALGHPQIGTALAMMHDDVAHRWTVVELARSVGMSRSAFALRFRTLVGEAPLEYLRRWRLHLADDAFTREAASVATMAGRLGYASESALGNAYKRMFGRSPKSRLPLA